LTSFCFEIFFAAAVGDVFAEDDNALVAAHLVAQRGVDEVGHGLVRGGGALAIGRGFGRANGRLSVERREVGSRSGE
jgi:hypothetical protein